MIETTREAQLSAAFAKIAKTLTTDFDLVDLLQTLAEECAAILDVDAAGIMLVDSTGELQLIVSTSEEASLVEVMALNAGSGPCVDCFTTGEPVTVGDIANSGGRWPEFAQESARTGYKSFHATPLRLRNRVIGVLNLFGTEVGALNDQDIAVAQTLSDVSAIGLLQEPNIADTMIIARQLQQAINARILIEQAKGVVAQLTKVPMTDAFSLLRAYAREHDMTLKAASQAAIDRDVTATALDELRAKAEGSDAQ
ncbi:GAF and ANTAR domain-containing protein [Marisediminicola senii]|uniref:GAF and ANTAR domain-containing protein n=1 Tax=Marisediminicola senii TaxID=2711233 RepID=UPI0013ECF903|nr:GAF and ANTAR domain-containing protein [Marisediminicola senii]